MALIDILVRARDQASSVLNRVSGSGDDMAARMQRASVAIRTAGEDIRRSVLTWGAPIAGAVKVFATFDDKMTQSLAIMNDVGDRMRAKMEQTARSVATSTTFSASQAAEAFYFLASTGLDAEQSIAALPAVARFAQAGMFDLARATEFLTDAQSALGLKSEDVAENMEGMVRVSDVLTHAANLSNASIEQFAASLTTKAGAAIRVLNKDVEEGVAVLAAYADQGVKGELAGEALNIVLRDLQTAARKNSREWEQLGVSVFDSSGNMRNIGRIVADLEGLLEGMTDKQKAATLAQLGFQDRSKAMLVTLLGTSDAIKEYENNLRDAGGVTEQVAGKQLQSFSSRMKLLWSRVLDAAIAIGERLAPTIEKAFSKVAGILEFVAAHADTAAKLLLALVASSVGRKVLALARNVDVLNLAMRRFWVVAALIAGLEIWDEISGGNDDAVAQWERLRDEFEAGEISLREYALATKLLHDVLGVPANLNNFAETQQTLTQQFRQGEITAEEYAAGLVELDRILGLNAEELKNELAAETAANEERRRSIAAIDATRAAWATQADVYVRSLEAMGGAARTAAADQETINRALRRGRRWAEEAAAAYPVFTSAIGEFTTKLDQTPKAFLKNAEKGEEWARRVGASVEELTQADIPQKVKRIIGEAGEQAVVAWASMNEGQKREFEKSLLAIEALRRGLQKKLEALGVKLFESGKETGRQAVKGLESGMREAASGAYAAADAIAAEIEARFRRALQEHSPSLVLMRVGEDAIAGLAKGLERSDRAEQAAEKAGRTTVAAVRRGMERELGRLRDAIADVVGEIESALSEGLSRSYLETARELERSVAKQERAFDRLLRAAEDRLNKVRDRIREFVDAIRSGFDDVADTIGGLMSAWSDAVSQEEQVRDRIAQIQEQLADPGTSIEQIAELRAELAELEAQLAGMGPPGLSGTDIQGFLTDQLAQNQALAKALEQLEALGLDPALLAELASQGPEALPLANALIAGGEDLVKMFNETQAAIDEFAKTTSDALSEENFGKRLERAADRVDKLRERIDRFIERIGEQIAEFLDALKTKSVAAKMDELISAIERAIRRLGGGGGGGGNTQTTDSKAKPAKPADPRPFTPSSKIPLLSGPSVTNVYNLQVTGSKVVLDEEDLVTALRRMELLHR